MIEQRPGITIPLAEAMGVTMTRAWQYVGRLEIGRVRRERSDER
jgi:hypothetical protein